MKVKDYLDNIIDNRGKNPQYLENGEYPVIDNVYIKNNYYINDNNVARYINQETYNNFLRGYVEKDMTIMTLVGSGIGNVGLIKSENDVIVQNTIGFKTKESLLSKYLYYWFLNRQDELKLFNRGSGQPSIKKTDIENMEICIPDINTQGKIVKILSTIDDKIELNNQTNDNLHELVNTIYKNTFEDLNEFKKAEEIANITIGKTPPRNIKECFSNDNNDIKWLSISDLGKCGMYAWNTSEKLTKEAIDNYNVKVIPQNTIVLSFKLTIGRIAIIADKMATNEAIAHFNLHDHEMIYFLYSYLKNFDYTKLGNTSSIATAVNSKIIKSMLIGIPSKEKMVIFNKQVKALFEKIKLNEQQNMILEQLRDTLLPKLMNGEIDLDKIEI